MPFCKANFSLPFFKCIGFKFDSSMHILRLLQSLGLCLYHTYYQTIGILYCITYMSIEGGVTITFVDLCRQQRLPRGWSSSISEFTCISTVDCLVGPIEQGISCSILWGILSNTSLPLMDFHSHFKLLNILSTPVYLHCCQCFARGRSSFMYTSIDSKMYLAHPWPKHSILTTNAWYTQPAKKE